MNFQNTREFAKQLDANDQLAQYKKNFIFLNITVKMLFILQVIHLDYKPKITKSYVDEIMNDWANMAVEGHFYADKPWWDYHERFCEPLSKIVGALPSEVGVMNTLTINLHLLLVSFYQPTATRYKIICEEKAFLQINICCKLKSRFMQK